jgi:uncharacterized membrane protein YphA (DoxX/SURF4 family)
MRQRTIVISLSYVFIFLFAYTGLSKLMDYEIFKEQISLSPLFDPIANWIAVVLPAAELIVSTLLFLPVTRLIGLWSFLGLMILFIAYIVYILNTNDHLPCTCGGVLQSLSWNQHIIFNVVFIVLGVIAILLETRLRLAIKKNTSI